MNKHTKSVDECIIIHLLVAESLIIGLQGTQVLMYGHLAKHV